MSPSVQFPHVEVHRFCLQLNYYHSYHPLWGDAEAHLYVLYFGSREQNLA